eukprot:scaffold24379_cov122-Isochrysis_galbana.AAC.4
MGKAGHWVRRACQPPHSKYFGKCVSPPPPPPHPSPDTEASTFGSAWWGCGGALKNGQRRVDLEGLADVLGALVANSVILKTVRAKQGAITDWENECALECGEHRVALEALADVLGAFRADAVAEKTARAKQGAITAVNPY